MNMFKLLPEWLMRLAGHGATHQERKESIFGIAKDIQEFDNRFEESKKMTKERMKNGPWLSKRENHT